MSRPLPLSTSFEIPAPPPEPRLPSAIYALRELPGVGRAVQALIARQMAQREQRYRNLLAILRARLAELLTAEQSTLAEEQPDPAACLRLATAAPERLWHRPAADLLLRVGSAARPSNLTVVAPSKLDPSHADPLIQAAQALAATAACLPEAPVCITLYGSCAVRGPRPQVLDTARALLVQLATHYAPQHLPVAIVFDAAEQDAWRWARWLPHVQMADGRRRLARDAASAALAVADSSVALLADAGLGTALPAGARRVYLLAEGAAVPEGCAAVLDVDSTLAGTLHIVGDRPVRVDRIDGACLELAERLARALYGRTATPSTEGEGIVEVHLDGTRTSFGAGSLQHGRP